MFLGYNDGFMGLAWYEEDLDKQYRDSIEEQDLKKYRKIRKQITELIKEEQ